MKYRRQMNDHSPSRPTGPGVWGSCRGHLFARSGLLSGTSEIEKTAVPHLADIRDPGRFVLHGRRHQVDYFGRAARFVLDDQLKVEAVIRRSIDGTVQVDLGRHAALAHFARMARCRTRRICRWVGSISQQDRLINGTFVYLHLRRCCCFHWDLRSARHPPEGFCRFRAAGAAYHPTSCKAK